MGAERIAIITARGGSKRIPRKNILPFCGKPLIAYAILAARESGLFAEVMVSTDDEEIAQVARDYGAAVPFLRSKEAADDHATTSAVLQEVLQTYAADGRTFETACCLYPTAPFVTAELLQEAAARLEESRADCVLPVAAFSFPPQRGMAIRDGKAVYVQPQMRDVRSQDLEPMYHDAGQFYFFRTAPFLETGVLVGDNTVAIVLPQSQVQDIDNPEDLEVAAWKYRFLQSQGDKDKD